MEAIAVPCPQPSYGGIDLDMFPQYRVQHRNHRIGVDLNQNEVRQAIEDLGGSFSDIILRDVAGRRITAWKNARIDHHLCPNLLQVEFSTVDANGSVRDTYMTVSLNGERPVINDVDGRAYHGHPASSEPMTLWRIQNEDGQGPFVSETAVASMNEAMTGDATVSYHNSRFPIPRKDELDYDQDRRFAALSLASLHRWFPKAAREALAGHGYHVVRVEVEAGAAWIGRSGRQALFDHTRATVTRVDA